MTPGQPEAANPAEPAIAALERAEEALAEAESLLARLAADAEADPRLLEQAEERLFALRAVARKHAVAVAELPALLDTLCARLAALDTGVAEIAALEQTVRRARETYIESAALLGGGAACRCKQTGSSGGKGAAAAPAEQGTLSRRRGRLGGGRLGAGRNGARAFPDRHQPGSGARPARQDRIRRRAVAPDARPEGRVVIRLVRADTGVRRGRCRCRGSHRGSSRRTAGPGGGGRAGAGGDAQSTSGGARQCASSGFEAGDARPRPRRGWTNWIRAHAARRSLACWQARRSPKPRVRRPTICWEPRRDLPSTVADREPQAGFTAEALRRREAEHGAAREVHSVASLCLCVSAVDLPLPAPVPA